MPIVYDRLGGEVLVNTTTEGNQTQPNVAVLADGGFVVVWVDAVTFEIKVQRFDASGNKAGSEFTANATTAGTQTAPTVAVLPSGAFVVSWMDNSGIGGDASNFAIKAQLFEADGDPLGAEFLVNTATLNAQSSPTITHLTGGGFVISWTDTSLEGGDASGSSVKARVYGAGGAPVGGEFLVNSSTLGSQSIPSIIALASGGFAIAWNGITANSNGGPFHQRSYVQLFDAAGAKIGAEQQINTETLGTQSGTSIAALATGFVVTWTDGSATDDTSGNGIKAQLFDLNGMKIGGEILVNTMTAGNQRTSQVDAVPGGGFLVTWTGPESDGGDSNIHGQMFDAAGARVGAEFVVNTTTAGEQIGQKVVVLPSGNIVLVWGDNSGLGGDASGFGVKYQILASTAAAPTDIALSNTSVSETGIENLPVATLSATGALTSSFTYAIVSDTTGGAFRIEGDRLVVADNGRLDFETAPSAELRIRATDLNGASYEETFTLAITDAAVEQRYAAGDEFVMPGNTQGFNSPQSIIQLASGNVLVVTSYLITNPGFSDGQRGQIYDAGGGPVGLPFELDLLDFGGVQSVAALPSGGFVVVYRGHTLVNGQLADLALRAQLFDATGAKIGSDIEITDGNGGGTEDASVAVLESGTIVITWTSGFEIQAQILNASGSPVGGIFQVNAASEGAQVWSHAAALPGGGFVVTWRDSDVEIRGQFFDASGNKVGGEFVTLADASEINDYQLAVLDSGELVVSWTELVDDSTEVHLFAVMAQRVGPDGANLGSPIAVATIAAGNFGAGHVLTAIPGGGFIVTWNSLHENSQDGDDSESWAQIFDSSGAPAGDPFSLPDSPAGGEDRPLVGALESGGLFFAWTNAFVVNDASASEAVGRMLFLPGDDVMGTSGNDVLDGGPGGDRMTGLAGDDVYIADHGHDVAVELPGGGTDIVHASVGYTLGDNVENLLLTGTAPSGAGNALANTITGNASANMIDGGLGADSMAGGLGNDVYFVDNVGDQVIEAANGGTDEVRTALASLSIASFANVEKLTGTTASGQALTGNDLANVIVGGAGNDILDGGLGADTMIGGLGNDAYVVDTLSDLIIEAANGGGDEIRTALAAFTLPGTAANVENLRGTSSTGQSLTGNDGANMIFGGSGNDLIDGGLGNDVMAGGLGNDVYVTELWNDNVIELAGQGIDEIRTEHGYDLGVSAEVENLTNTSVSNAILTGNALNNTIRGGTGDNLIDGGIGSDTMIGGIGSDVYIVDNAADAVVELAGEGTDEVRTGLAAFSIASFAHVEKLTGTSASDQTLTGNGMANVITAGGGNDILNGGLGADTMNGSGGNDTYVVDNAGDTIVEAAGGGTDTVQSGITFTIGAEIERLTLTGTAAIDGTGNGLANIITGNAGNNVLDGAGGSDLMVGGLGNDTFVLSEAGDTVSEQSGQGSDTVRAGFNYTLGDHVENLVLLAGAVNGTGNGLVNAITGNDAANTLDGRGGADAMSGGLGDDLYIVDNAGDSVLEAASAGTDTVQASVSHTLGNNVENLVLLAGALNGTGNSLANSIIGNGANNTLNGGGGADAMAGGAGHDTYIVDNAGDVVTEAGGAGNDTVQSSVTHTLGDNVEHLTLTGTGAISATGNGLNNIINGNSAANILNGGIGADFLTGGGGDDTYVVDSASDQVTEAAGGGTDTVQSAVNWTLGANVERLTLTGTASLAGTGNDLANIITGNAAANVINGGIGADTMQGGLGNDTFIVDNVGDVLADTGGVDTAQSSVTFTLGSTIDNLTLTGTDAVNGTGNTLWNVMIGNSAANTLDGGVGNDVLNGGGGADTLIGGAGHDTYHVDNAGDQVVDTGGGNDHVHAAIDYVLGSDLEYLTLTGSAVSGTGNAKNNLIYGNAGNNVIDGGLGVDFMVGGMGDDVYYVDSGSDSITEHLNQGTDTVMSSVNHALRGNIENLTLIGTNQAIATGNTLNNVLTGNSANNILYGGLGADTMSDGGGNDVFQYRATAESTAASKDQINGFSAGDKINLSGIDAIAGTPANNDAFTFIGGSAFTGVAGQLRAEQNGANWTIEADVNGDGLADLVIGLTTDGGYLIGAADFVL